MNDICEDLHRKRMRDPVTGILFREEWFDADGHRHRDDGPALSKFDRISGNLVEQSWFRFNCKDRSDGPAWVQINNVTGIHTAEIWMQNDMRHRLDGPAVTFRDDKTGEAYREVYYLHDTEVQRDQIFPSPEVSP